MSPEHESKRAFRGRTAKAEPVSATRRCIVCGGNDLLSYLVALPGDQDVRVHKDEDRCREFLARFAKSAELNKRST